MGLVVPFLVSAFASQAEIGAEIDQLGREGLEEIDLSHRLAVGQTKKQQIAGPQLGHFGELQLGALAQIGMRLENELAGRALRGDLRDFSAGMAEQETQQLSAGVAGAANDSA